MLLLLMAVTVPTLAAKSYCCLTADGHPVCGDLLPKECYGRPYREISERGIVLRQIEAPLTAEQKAKHEAELKQQKEEQRIANEKRRQAQMLFNIYASERDIDFIRDRTLADLDNVRQQALARYQDALKQQKQLANEAEFYKKKPMPRDLKAEIQANEAELQTQLAIIQGKQKEMEAAQAKFDRDKKRYLELVQPKNLVPSASTPETRPR
jgi:hypothetical protein